MKKIEAFLHRKQAVAVVDAFDRVGIGNYSLSQVKGTLPVLASADSPGDADLGENFTVLLQVFCVNNNTDETLDIIRRSGQGNQAISGWVFMSQVEAAWPIPGATQVGS